jgi:hypothetical protein
MNIVADHVKQLVELVAITETEYQPVPKESLTPKEQQLFWRYHGHFPNDFARGIAECLPDHQKFIQYDHLTNRVTVEVV